MQRDLISLFKREIHSNLINYFLMVFFAGLASLLVAVQPLIVSAVLSIALPNDFASSPDTIARGMNLNTIGSMINEFVFSTIGFFERIEFNSLIFKISILLVIYVLVVSLGSLAAFCSAYILSQLKAAAIARLRCETFSDAIKNYKPNERIDSGKLTSMLIKDCADAGNGIAPIIQAFVQHGTLIGVLVYYLVITDASLTLGILIVFALQYCLVKSLRRRTLDLQKNIYKTSAHFGEKALSLYGLIYESWLYSKANFVSGEAAKAFDRSRMADFKGAVIRAAEPRMREVLDGAIIAVVIWYAFYRYETGYLELEGVVMFAYVGRMILSPVSKFSVIFLWFSSLQAAYFRLSQLNRETVNRSTLVAESPMALTLSDLSIAGTRMDLTTGRSLNEEFPNTGLIFVLGDSGSGKSSLLDAIVGFRRPENGSIQVSENIGRSAHIFSYFSNDLRFFDSTLAENILLDDFPKKLDQLKIFIREQSWLSFLDEEALELPISLRKYSTGQIQRILLARTFFVDTPIVVLDEPTSALDAEMAGLVFRFLRELSRDKLVLVATHEVAKATEYNSQIIWL